MVVSVTEKEEEFIVSGGNDEFSFGCLKGFLNSHADSKVGNVCMIRTTRDRLGLEIGQSVDRQTGYIGIQMELKVYSTKCSTTGGSTDRDKKSRQNRA